MFQRTDDSSASSSICLSLKLALILSLTFNSWTVSAEQPWLAHTLNDIAAINSTVDGAFILGIRTAVQNDFEVRLEKCQQTSSMQSPEVAYITIIKSGEYPTSDGIQVQVKQRLLWEQYNTILQQIVDSSSVITRPLL